MPAVNITRWAKQAGTNLEDTVLAIKLELFSSVILDTRVRTGRLRGNWQTSTGNPKKNTIERFDKSGSQATREAEANITVNGVDYMTNNLPYAAVWNEKDGMIDKNLARLTEIINGAVKQNT